MNTTTSSLGAAIAAVAILAGAAWAGDPLFDSPSRSFHTGDRHQSEAYQPRSIAASDLDGDGDLDVAVAHQGNYLAPKMSLLFNKGDGSYAQPVFVPVSGENDEIAAGDVDGDGDPDLVLTRTEFSTQGQGLLVLLNRGNGTFEPERAFPTGVNPIGLALADVDRDGDLDAVTANHYWGENDVSVIYNDGAGDFSTRVDFPVGAEQPEQVAAGDLDGDGYPDLAITVRYGNPHLTVLFNDAAGGFGAPVGYQANSTPYTQGPGVEVADVDRDGDMDVLLAEDAGGFASRVAIFRNDGTGDLSAVDHATLTVSFGAVQDFEIADLTGDGWPDIAGVATSSAYGWVLLPSDGAGGFGAATAFRTGEAACSIESGDADGDGDLDVVVADTGSINLTVHLSDGGAFRMPPDIELSGGAGEIDSADVDGDGDEDLVTVDSALSTLLSDGAGGFALRTTQPGIGPQQALELVDLDLDGDPDLLTLDDAPPYYFHVLLNDGAGNWGAPSSYLIGSCGPGDIIAVDYDEDGDRDVVISEYLGCPGSGSEKLWLWSNAGNGTFFFHSVIGSFSITQAEQLEAGDFDGDGHVDLITTHPDAVGWWRGHGNGTFDVAVMADIGDWGPKFVTTADLDGDGHLDVATYNIGNSSRGESVSVLRGYGDGGFRIPQVDYGMFSLHGGSPAGIEAVDVDLDGDLDLIAGVHSGDDLALLRNRGDGTFAPQERYGVDGVALYVKAAQLDGDRIPDVALSIGTGPPYAEAMAFLFGRPATDLIEPYCLCSAGAPCGNVDPAAGCANSTGSGGLLSASGSASVAADDLFLVASQLPANKNGLLFMGGARIGPLPLGDGQLCVGGGGTAGGGGLRRFPVQSSGPQGSFTRGPIVGHTHANFPPAAQIAPGQTWRFQVWHRDPQGPCGQGSNLTSALSITFAP